MAVCRILSVQLPLILINIGEAEDTQHTKSSASGYIFLKNLLYLINYGQSRKSHHMAMNTIQFDETRDFGIGV